MVCYSKTVKVNALSAVLRIEYRIDKGTNNVTGAVYTITRAHKQIYWIKVEQSNTYSFQFDAESHWNDNPCTPPHRSADDPKCCVDFHNPHWYQLVLSMTSLRSARGWKWWPYHVFHVSCCTRMHIVRLAFVQYALYCWCCCWAFPIAIAYTLNAT